MSNRNKKFVLDNLGCIILAALATCGGCAGGAFLIKFFGG